MVRDVLGGESASSSQPYSTLDAYSCMSNIPSYERKRDSLSSGTQTHISAPTVPSLGRKPDLSSSGSVNDFEQFNLDDLESWAETFLKRKSS